MLGIKTNETGPLSLKSSVQEVERKALGEGVGTLNPDAGDSSNAELDA